MKIFHQFVLAGAIASIFSFVSCHLQNAENTPDYDFEIQLYYPYGPRSAAASAASLTAAMSLAEKAAQVLIVSPGHTTQASEGFLRSLQDIPVGGVILLRANMGTSAADLQQFIGILQQASRAAGSGIPLFISLDHEGGTVFRLHGIASQLPDASLIGSGDMSRQAAYSLYKNAAAQLRLLGFSMNFAPILEPLLPENSDFLRYRSYSADPDTVFYYGGAAAAAMQATGILPVAKHFPGSGDGDPHFELPLFSPDADSIDHPALRAFVRAVREQNLPALMSAHVMAPGLDSRLPATVSPSIQTRLLRHEIGFSGLLITDDLHMRGMTIQYEPADAAVAALAAGADMLLAMGGGIDRIHRSIITAVAAGELEESRLDEATARILEHKLRLDLWRRSEPEQFSPRSIDKRTTQLTELQQSVQQQ